MLLRRFLLFARPYRGVYALGALLLLATNGLALSIPWLLREAINAMEDEAPLATIAGYAGAMAGVALVAAIVRTGSRLCVLGNSRRIVHDVRRHFYQQLQRLDAGFYDTHRTGDLMSRGINDLRLLRSFFGPGVLMSTNTLIIYIGGFALLFSIDPLLTLYSIVLFPPLLIAVKMISSRVYRRSMEVQETLSELSNKTQENLSGIQQVRIYGQEEREVGAFEVLCTRFRQRTLSMALLRGWMVALIGVVTGAEALIVIYFGGQHVISGRITFGDFVAFNAYLGMLAWPTIALGWIINVFQRGLGAMERLAEILDAEPDLAPAADEQGVGAPEPVEGLIQLKNLTFRHGGKHADPHARPALRDVSLTIEQGTRVALVGGVGSGKSTFANLLAKVYPAPPGTLFIGGEDASTVSSRRHRASVGYVPQEAFLFSRTVRENIAFGRPDADDEDIARVVTLSQLEEELDVFPEGLDTIVGERGYTLSGGQRQRVTLARALLQDPRILILDDSLSAVDADTENAILDGLDRVMEGRTSILITHRPAVLTRVDRILVFEAGRLVEDGTHDALMQAKGVYEQLFHQHQLERRLEAS